MLCGGLCLNLAMLAAEDRMVSGPVLELPPMVVTSNQGLVWRYAEMPGYEILSCCSDSMTRDFMQGLARAESLVRLLVPVTHELGSVRIERDREISEDVAKR